MSEDDKKKKKGEEERSYSGSKTPDDLEFAKWICKQWARGEKLEKLDIIQYFPKGANKGYGEVVDFEVFQTAHDVDMEEAVDLSNRFIAAAKLNVNRIERKPTHFYARANDRGRGSEAVDSFPLLIEPTKIFRAGATPTEDDEDATPQRVALAYLQEGIRAHQRDRDREDANVGDLLAMFIQERREQRAYEAQLQAQNRQIMQDWVSAVREREAALLSEADRALRREITKLKIDAIREGGRFGKNVLTGLLGSGGDVDAKALPENAASSGAERVVTTMTQERRLLDEFFRDCKNAGIDNALFGTWEKGEDGKPKIVKPGIFTVDQFFILGRVHAGHAHADDLDDLLMDSGKPVAVTPQQLVEAQKVVDDSIGITLAQIIKIRQEKRAARAAASENKPSPPTTTPAAIATATPPPTPNVEEYTDV